LHSITPGLADHATGIVWERAASMQCMQAMQPKKGAKSSEGGKRRGIWKEKKGRDGQGKDESGEGKENDEVRGEWEGSNRKEW